MNEIHKQKMNRINLLITRANTVNNDLLVQLDKLSINVIIMEDEKDNISCSPEVVELIICNSFFLYHDISLFTKLKYIQLTSVGLDRTPMEYINKNNITINNARGVYSIPMAEFVISSILNILKKQFIFKENQNEKIWLKNRDILELNGMNICIIGCGSVGNECAKRLKSFDCNLIGIDLFPRIDKLYDHMYSINDIKNLLINIDILILTLPLTPESYHLIGENELSSMKSGSIIVNVARGSIIDTEALIKYVDRFRGIALDVFENEPLDSKSILWELNNVFITPHISFIGNNNAIRINNVIISNLKKYLGETK